MSTWLRRLFYVLIALVLVVVIVAAVYIPRAARQSFPQIEGEVQLDGLHAPVDVYRDSYGIPHIYASSSHDLFMAQGYVHAQDRFWQMDFNRHVGAGRLSELLGSSTIGTDVFLRTMGWERVAREELQMLDAHDLLVLEAYSAGVNAYLAERQGSDLALEYLFLNILNSSYEPAPWEPLNTLTWAKAMAWDLRDNMDAEIERAILLDTLPADQVADIFPDYPDDKPIIVPGFEPGAGDSESSVRPAGELLANVRAPLSELGRQANALDSLLGADFQESLGSNSWVVSGELTASGMPLLANDPHLGASMPSIWYQVGLHCQPVSDDCPYEVNGVSFPGTPGVVIGHNAQIAWGFTNVGPDVMDLFIIRVNPENELQYEMNGEWVEMEVVREEVQVAGDETIEVPVRITEFGPIVSDSYGDLEDFDETSGVELPENYAIALRWTALEQGRLVHFLLRMNRASNWQEFRAAAEHMTVPAQNLVYADVEGNIGYQMPGNIPIRANGDGRLPAPGWTDEYAWQGYIPFEELPHLLNPSEGYIVTANNAVVGSDYPYQIADNWDYGYRAQRVVDMLEAANGPLDSAYFQQMQADSVNLGALDVLPYLMDLELEDDELEEARAILEHWDGSQEVDSAPAALFNVFWANLLEKTFHDQLPEDYWPGGSSPWYATVANLLGEPDNAWWDDAASEAVEERDEMLRAAFAGAVDELSAAQGRDPGGWNWGDLHGITFEHEVMSNFPLIDQLFNRGPFPVAGGSSIVNATNWNASSGDYAVTSLPSKRSIMDLSDWQNSLQISTTGQSGNPYHDHYIDMAPVWAQVDYFTMNWDRNVIEAEAEGHLRLLP